MRAEASKEGTEKRNSGMSVMGRGGGWGQEDGTWFHISLKETPEPRGAGVETQFSKQPHVTGNNNNVMTMAVKGSEAAAA